MLGYTDVTFVTYCAFSKYNFNRNILRLVSWGIVMVENPIIGPKFMPFFYAQLHVTASVFAHNKLGCFFDLAEGIGSDIEENHDCCLHL